MSRSKDDSTSRQDPSVSASVSDRLAGEAAGRLSGKVAIITGAGRGIGRATAELFAREGARVVLSSRTTSELNTVLSAIKKAGKNLARSGSSAAVARRADIGSPREARELVRFTVRQFGGLDILINNAGILGPLVPITDYPMGAWQRVLRINLSGTFYVTREAARVMASQGSGCIINISSSVGRVGRAQWGAYAVSKFGTEGLSQVLADELRGRGICVVSFNPGGTRTGMRAEAYPDEDPRRLKEPVQPAQALLKLALSATPALSGKAFDMDTVPE